MIDIFEDHHGNAKVKPIFPFVGTSPLPVFVSIGRKIIEDFNANGTSGHSSVGSTLWVIMAHCTINDIPFQLTFQPALGYEIRRIERLHI